MLFAFVWLVAGCPSGSPQQPDGGSKTHRLEAVGETTLGLSYGEVRALDVRLIDESNQPVVGMAIHFGIFGDPRGSTLSADRTITGANGVVNVNLTAGADEAQFRVVVSTPDAEDLQFNISVSRFAFVEVDVQLAYTGSELGRVTSMEARLYDQMACADLDLRGPLPEALRRASAPGKIATIAFPYLLAVDFALVGRALDDNDQPVAAGCVDLSSVALQAASLLVVQVPLDKLLPSILGQWILSVDIPLPSPAWVATWRKLSSCELAPAQVLLDAIDECLEEGELKTALASHRGTPDPAGCRPEQVTDEDSADKELQDILWVDAAPATRLAAMNADIAAIVTSQALSTNLGLASSGSGDYFGLHRLSLIHFSGVGGSPSADFPFGGSGYPVIEVIDVPATFDGVILHLARHCFTLRLPDLWRRAVGTIALGSRDLPPTALELMTAIVAAAQVGPATGCEAVESLLCDLVGPIEPCDLRGACENAIVDLGDSLEAGFLAQPGEDFCIEGTATAVDSDLDLVVDRLTGGSFSAAITIASGSDDVLLPWSGERPQATGR